MSQWLIDIEREVKRANEAQRMRNAGRVRTAARRIAGIAIGELQRHTTQFRRRGREEAPRKVVFRL